MLYTHIYTHIYTYLYLLIYLSIYPANGLSIHVSVYLSISCTLACSSVMHVSTPNETGMPVCRPTVISADATESEMASKWYVSPLIRIPTGMIASTCGGGPARGGVVLVRLKTRANGRASGWPQRGAEARARPRRCGAHRARERHVARGERQLERAGHLRLDDVLRLDAALQNGLLRRVHKRVANLWVPPRLGGEGRAWAREPEPREPRPPE